MTVIRADTPMTPDQQQGQQMARQELSQSKYHTQPPTSPPASATSSAPALPTPSPTPTPTASQHSSGGLTIVLVILLIVILGTALLLILRKIGKPRTDVKTTVKGAPGKTTVKGASLPQRPLTGAAAHRYNAEQAADAGDWQEAIRERFRAVILVLDERGLLPERRDRTADEAARDAGEILPEHAEALRSGARAFDEVEYGEYLGSPEGYRVICAVDDAVSTQDRAVRR